MESERNKEVAGFKEVLKAPLIDVNNNNNLTTQSSTELWLIQCPLHHALDLDDEQDLSLTLHRDGLLGNFKDSSGKSYDVVGLAVQNSNATVFLSSATAEPKMVGKISRYVSLVHYPDPSEPHKRNESFEMQKQRSGKSLTNSSHHLSARSQSVRPRSSKPSSTQSSRRKSSLSEEREPAKPKKRKPMEDHAGSTGQSTLDSGRGTSSGSLRHSNERKSKKNNKV